MGDLKSIQIGDDIIDFEKMRREIIDQAVNYAEQLQPRNIMDILGTTDVKQTFLKLKEYSSQGDFHLFRLGDYIEVPSLHTYGRVKFEIVAFDHYLNRGTTNNIITQHHITMMSYDCVERRQMHSSNENRYYHNRDLSNYLNTTVNNAIITATGITPLPITLQTDYHNSITGTLSVYVPTVEEVMSPGAGWGTLNYRGRQWWNDQSAWGQYGSPTLSNQFPLFAKYPHRMRKKLNGTIIPWWTSTPGRDHTTGFCVVPADGVDALGNGNAFVAGATLSRGLTLTFNL